jgi:hypothetical protein
MKFGWGIRRMTLVSILSLALNAGAQSGTSSAALVSACPVQVADLHVFWISVQVTNTSGKKIVGMVFNAALADPTERWKWLHQGYNDRQPLQGFGWNTPLEKAETTKISWRADLARGGYDSGVAFVLTRVLFADGSSWEEARDSATCKATWHGRHKKGFSKPVELPPRE